MTALATSSLEARLPSYEGLSHGAAAVLAWLRQMPLASVRDLASFHDVGESPYYAWLWELSERGLARVSQMGASKRKVGRWWLTPEGMSSSDLRDGGAHREFFLSNLLARLPAVEWFYPLARELERDLGRLHEFRWFSGMPWDAAVLYEQGWVLLFWSGSLQTESKLSNSLSRLGDSLERHSMLGGPAWPSALCFVASDHWQRELVFRAARSQSLQHVRVWCIADGSSSGSPQPGQGRGWISQEVSSRSMGPETWSSRLRNSLWTLDGGNGSLLRLMRGVYEWPLLTSSLARLILGFDPSDRNKRISHLMRSLLDHGGLDHAVKDGSRRYFLTRAGVEALAVQDRVHSPSMARRHFYHPGEGDPSRGAGGQHEEGLMSLMSGFYAGGLPAAVGWRSWEHLWGRGRGGISPDGLVMLNSGPFGGGWHYVEYERSAKGRYRANRKLRGYASNARQDGWPVLFVLWSDRAEQNFQSLGRGMQVRMLTTTIKRLAERGTALSDCWSLYGYPVALG